MEIAVYGAGYVGLVSALCFANFGHNVIVYDVNAEKINHLKEGRLTIVEKDLDLLLQNAIKLKSVTFTNNSKEAASFANMYLICVGTPSNYNGSADLSFLYSAVENIALHINEPFSLIIKSTVPVGTCYLMEQYIQKIFLNRGVQIPFDIISCPEFLAQGEAVYDFIHPERIIIGTDNDLAFEKVKALYDPLLRLQMDKGISVIRMSPRAAELVKYASNLFLATKISFMNEISRIAEIMEVDITEMLPGFIADKRIGPAMSHPGCGFGGSCFPKDLKSMINQASALGYHPALLEAVQEVNIQQKTYFIGKIFEFFNQQLKNKVIAIWGMSFKPNTDDMRESVSCNLIEALLNAGAIVQAYDPMANYNARQKFHHHSNFKVCDSKEKTLDKADLLAVMTGWSEFLNLDIAVIKGAMQQPVIFDGRNIYKSHDLISQGISYFSIGTGINSLERRLQN